MGVNTEVLTSFIGKLKIISLVIGLIAIILTADTYIKVSGEEFFLAIVIICFLITFLTLIIFVVGIVEESEQFRKIDFVIHALFGLLLLISMITWFISVSDYKHLFRNGRHIERIFAGLFGGLYGVIYLFLAYLLLKASGLIG